MIPEKFVSKEFLSFEYRMDFGICGITDDKIIGYIEYKDGYKENVEWDRLSLIACRGMYHLKLNMPAIKNYIINSDDSKSRKLELLDFIVEYYESQLEDCY